MIDAGCAGIRGVGVGARHHTMHSVTMALVMRGVSPCECESLVEAAHASNLNPAEVHARRNAVKAAIRWANAKVWGGSVEIAPVQLRVNW